MTCVLDISCGFSFRIYYIILNLNSIIHVKKQDLELTDDNLLYLDNHLIVVKKSAGMLVQGDYTGDVSLFELTKEYLRRRFDKKGQVYLGLVHRLDRPVAGIIAFARTSKAAARLNEQIRNRTFVKIYRALVHGRPPANGEFIDYIIRNGATSVTGSAATGKKAVLNYQLLKYHQGISLVEIDLCTGRHHQIRVQFAQRGFPVVGDFRYGSKQKFGNKALALYACRLQFAHPVLKTTMEFNIPPEVYWPRDFTME